MLDVFLDALIDSLKTLPFLFAAYFLIEYLEHRASSKMERGLQKSAFSLCFAVSIR